MPFIRSVENGIQLSLRVTTRAGKNAVTAIRDDLVLLSVRAAPTDGEANSAVIQTLADTLKIAKSRIQLIRGTKSREKIVEITGLTLELLAGMREIILVSVHS
jgi:uncharacterized protein (TIGR00251 family)